MGSQYELELVTARLSLSPVEGLELPLHGGEGAAVSLILRAGPDAGEAELLFIRRAEREDDPWSGHMALPGGRRDPADRSLLETAVRETREEVGVDLLEAGKALGHLASVDARARGKRLGLTVIPFVFSLVQEVVPLPNEEVAEALWAPLGALGRGELRSTYPFEYDGQRFELPCHRLGDRVIWGLTFGILESFFRAIE